MALHLAYSWAKSLFEKSPISPERDCYDQGQQCQLCHYKVEPTNCIVVCKCEKFSHYNCLKAKFSSVTLTTRKEARCQKCQEVIKITYEEKKVFKPRMQVCLFLEMMLALAFLIQCIYFFATSVAQVKNTMEKVTNQRLFNIGIAIIGIIFSIGWIVIIFRKILWKSVISIKEIYPAPMEIKINSFEEASKSQFPSVQTINDHSQDGRFDKIEILGE